MRRQNDQASTTPVSEASRLEQVAHRSPLRPAIAPWLAVGLLVATGPALAENGIPGPELGAGVARPVALDPQHPLYFFLAPPYERARSGSGSESGSAPESGYLASAAPDDSLTLRMGEFSLEIATAPSWFAPETVKLDYDLLLFRALSVTRDWVEVIVNESLERPRSFPRTAWVTRESLQFIPWAEFLLDVYSVEPRDPATNPLRSGPDASFPEVAASDGRDFHVIAVQGSWILVEDTDAHETAALRGWLRWREGDTLVVLYWLLS